MASYYEILGLARDASPSEIKAAFRKRVKEFHPDLHTKKNASADKQRDRFVHKIIEAYRILKDPEKRRLYNRSLKFDQPYRFEYREFLLARQKDPESMAKLIVYDLLHNLEDEAIAIYEENRRRDRSFRLERYFERGEAMDIEFCLAEEYIRKGSYIKAFKIIQRLIIMENEKPAFKFYFEILLEIFRELTLNKLGEQTDTDVYGDYLSEAADLPINLPLRIEFLQKKIKLLGSPVDSQELLRIQNQIASLSDQNKNNLRAVAEARPRRQFKKTILQDA